jgi:CDP-glycerol glycerophosphotransferase (TagB/SpsB family)
MDSIMNPILEYLPKDTYKITEKIQDDCFNVSFFTEHIPHKDVFLCHGIADKKYHDGNRVGDYDYICVSGVAWKNKLINQGVKEKKIWVVGYSKLDPLFNNSTKVINNDNKIHVLYAPTHNMHKDKNVVTMSCYPRFNKYLNNVPEDIEIMESQHPANKSDCVTTFNLLKWANVTISDCSSVLYESLALGIPVVFPDWLVKQSILSAYPKSFEYQIYNEGIGYHANTIDNLWDLVRQAKNKGLNTATKTFIDGIVDPNTKGISGKLIANKLLESR